MNSNVCLLVCNVWELHREVCACMCVHVHECVCLCVALGPKKFECGIGHTPCKFNYQSVETIKNKTKIASFPQESKQNLFCRHNICFRTTVLTNQDRVQTKHIFLLSNHNTVVTRHVHLLSNQTTVLINFPIRVQYTHFLVNNSSLKECNASVPIATCCMSCHTIRLL